MPKLRSLNGQGVIAIFEQFGFSVIRVKGSHHIMRRIVEGKKQVLNVPVHGRKPLRKGTLHSVYRDGCQHIPEDELRPHFYTE
ncbi:MAG: type II toxin-antitoxin system HicA family toxin [Chloroflexi bacterium]|nr:type II toxin-antitoxin system HicA family toxin [Chloroflexota bacterium]